MQCIWQSLTRSLPNALSRVPTSFSYARPAVSWTSPYYGAIYCPKTTTTHIFRRLHTTALSPPTPKWTRPSRLALSATKAVHASLRRHAIEDAVMIVNTIRYAALPEAERENKAWDAVKRSQVTLPTGVSPRLPAHALLHGLLRIGMPQQASQIATSMMSSGTRVRGRTLGMIMGELSRARTVKNFASDAGNARLKNHMESLLCTSKILSLDSLMSSEPNTAFALKLLHAARKSKSQRTEAMFNTLITICLINGEIIIASLLFGFLVKDWERRSQLLSKLTSRATSDPPSKSSSEGSDGLKGVYHIDLLTKNMRPTPEMLKAIVQPIREKLGQAAPDDVEGPDFQEPLQALANLAVLLNNRQLPFPQVSSLLRALYDCPRVKNWVWVIQKEKRICVPAYRYFHRTLLNLIWTLPTHRPQIKTFLHQRRKPEMIQFRFRHPIQRMQPPLDSASYNALIHYAFRHRFSPSLATKIYEHMTIERQPPLSERSLATYNIYLRSAALYRRRDVTSDPVRILNELCSTDVSKKVIQRRPKFLELHRNLKHTRRKLRLPPAPSMKEILSDPYTLSTYLSSLISCGQPNVVVGLMRTLLPVFELKSAPPKLTTFDAERNKKWKESLSRAVEYGPVVLCTFLHALVQSGITRDTHQLFNLILHASHLSQHPDLAQTHKPWHVTVAIYTTMLHAYKKEFDQLRRRTGTRIYDYLLHRTTRLYHRAKADVMQNMPVVGRLDSRFYSAILKILAEFLPEKQLSRTAAGQHYGQVHQQYAKKGLIDDTGRLSLLEEVVADMSLNSYPIPIGFHHLFITEGAGILNGSHNLPELDRRPFAFSESKKGSGTAYTLPVLNKKTIWTIR